MKHLRLKIFLIALLFIYEVKGQWYQTTPPCNLGSSAALTQRTSFFQHFAGFLFGSRIRLDYYICDSGGFRRKFNFRYKYNNYASASGYVFNNYEGINMAYSCSTVSRNMPTFEVTYVYMHYDSQNRLNCIGFQQSCSGTHTHVVKVNAPDKTYVLGGFYGKVTTDFILYEVGAIWVNQYKFDGASIFGSTYLEENISAGWNHPIHNENHFYPPYKVNNDKFFPTNTTRDYCPYRFYFKTNSANTHLQAFGVQFYLQDYSSYPGHTFSSYSTVEMSDGGSISDSNVKYVTSGIHQFQVYYDQVDGIVDIRFDFLSGGYQFARIHTTTQNGIELANAAPFRKLLYPNRYYYQTHELFSLKFTHYNGQLFDVVPKWKRRVSYYNTQQLTVIETDSLGPGPRTYEFRDAPLQSSSSQVYINKLEVCWLGGYLQYLKNNNQIESGHVTICTTDHHYFTATECITSMHLDYDSTGITFFRLISTVKTITYGVEPSTYTVFPQATQYNCILGFHGFSDQNRVTAIQPIWDKRITSFIGIDQLFRTPSLGYTSSVIDKSNMYLSHYNDYNLNQMMISKVFVCQNSGQPISGVFFEYKNATHTRQDTYYSKRLNRIDNCQYTLYTIVLQDKEFIYKFDFIFSSYVQRIMFYTSNFNYYSYGSTSLIWARYIVAPYFSQKQMLIGIESRLYSTSTNYLYSLKGLFMRHPDYNNPNNPWKYLDQTQYQTYSYIKTDTYYTDSYTTYYRKILGTIPFNKNNASEVQLSYFQIRYHSTSEYIKRFRFGHSKPDGTQILEPQSMDGSYTHTTTINLSRDKCITQVRTITTASPYYFTGFHFFYRSNLPANSNGFYSSGFWNDRFSFEPVFRNLKCLAGYEFFIYSSYYIVKVRFIWEYRDNHFRNYFMSERAGRTSFGKMWVASTPLYDESYVYRLGYYRHNSYISGIYFQIMITANGANTLRYYSELAYSGNVGFYGTYLAQNECIVQAIVYSSSCCVYEIQYHTDLQQNVNSASAIQTSYFMERVVGNFTNQMCIVGTYYEKNGDYVNSVGFYFRGTPTAHPTIKYMDVAISTTQPHNKLDRFIDRYIDDSSYISKIQLYSTSSTYGLQGIHTTYNTHASDKQVYRTVTDAFQFTADFSQNDCIYQIQVDYGNVYVLALRIYSILNFQSLYITIARPVLKQKSFMFDGTLNTCLHGFRGFIFPKTKSSGNPSIRGLGPIVKNKNYYSNIASLSNYGIVTNSVGIVTSNTLHDTFCLVDFYQHIVSIQVCTGQEGVYGLLITYDSGPSNTFGSLTGSCKTITYDMDSIYEVQVQTGSAPFPIKSILLKSSQHIELFGRVEPTTPTVFSDYPNYRMYGLAGFMGSVDSNGYLSSLKGMLRKQEYSFYTHWQITKKLFQPYISTTQAGLTQFIDNFPTMPGWQVSSLNVCAKQRISSLQLTYLNTNTSTYRLSPIIGHNPRGICQTIDIPLNDYITHFYLYYDSKALAQIKLTTNSGINFSFPPNMQYFKTTQQILSYPSYVQQITSTEMFLGFYGYFSQDFLDNISILTVPRPTTSGTVGGGGGGGGGGSSSIVQVDSTTLHTAITAIKTNFFTSIQSTTLLNSAAISTAFATVTQHLDTIKTFIKDELAKINAYNHYIQSIDWTISLFAVIDILKSTLEKESYLAIMKVFSEEIFTKENLESGKYLLAHNQFYNQDEVLQSGRLGNTANFDSNKWMSYYPDTQDPALMNLPSTFNSLSYLLEDLYSTYPGISLLYQTQEKTMSLATQLATGVRGLDIRVNRGKAITSTTTANHYYCAGRTSPYQCYDFLLMSDFLPLYSMTMSQVMQTLLDFLSTNPSEFLFLRLTCQPDQACEDDWELLRLIHHFLISFQPIDQPRSAHKVIVVDNLHEFKLGDLRGKVVVNLRQFPEGYSQQLYDLCYPGYDHQQSDWTTLSSTHYFYPVDKVQQKDTWDYSDVPTLLKVQTLSEWVYKLSRVGENDFYLPSQSVSCTHILTLHASSYLILPRVFHKANKQLQLLSTLGLQSHIGIVYTDFTTLSDVLAILAGQNFFRKSSVSYPNFSVAYGNTSPLVYLESKNKAFKLVQTDTSLQIQKSDGTLVKDVLTGLATDTATFSFSYLNGYDQFITLNAGTTASLNRIAKPSFAYSNEVLLYTHPTIHPYRLFDYNPNKPEIGIHLTNQGQLIGVDRLGIGWWYIQSTNNRVTTSDEVSIIYSPDGLGRAQVVTISTNSVLQLQRNQAGTWTTFFSYTQPSINDPFDNLVVFSNGNMQLGPLTIELQRYNSNPKLTSLPFYNGYYLQLQNDLDLQLFHLNDQLLWSLNTGSKHYVKNILKENEYISGTSGLNSTGNLDTFKLLAKQPSQSGLEVWLGSTKIVDLVAPTGLTFNDPDQKWHLHPTTCALDLSTTVTTTSYSLNMANILAIQYGQIRSCVLELTQQGEVKIYDTRQPFIYVYYLHNAIALHLYELSIPNNHLALTFQEQVITSNSIITMNDQCLVSHNKLFSACLMSTGHLHVYYSPLPSPLTSIHPQRTLYYTTQLTTGTSPFIFHITSTGLILIKDSAATTIFTSATTAGTPPYYLLLGNDGSFILYDSLQAKIFTFTAYLQGLNNMVRHYYKEYYSNSPLYHELDYGYTFSHQYLFKNRDTEYMSVASLGHISTVTTRNILYQPSGKYYCTLHKNTLITISSSPALFDSLSFVYQRSLFHSDYAAIPDNNFLVGGFHLQMKDVANDNDHAMFYITKDNGIQYTSPATFDKTLPCYIDNYQLQLTSGPDLVLYSYDGTVLKSIWSLKSATAADIPLTC